MLNPNKDDVWVMSIDLPSANPSLISNKTTSLAILLYAIASAHVEPTFPAPTTVTFLNLFFSILTFF